jgi:hypothetical protein
MASPDSLKRRLADFAPYLLLALLYGLVLVGATDWLVLSNHMPPYWTSWEDQQQYLRSADAFAALRLDPADHWYPLLYSLLVAPFTILTPRLPFAMVDLICILAAFASFRRVAATFAIGAWLALPIFVATTLLEPHIARNWIEPWTTTLSAALIWLALGEVVPPLVDRERRPSHRRLALLGGLLALLPLARPADLLVAAPLALFLAKPLLVDRRDGGGIAALLVGAAVPLAAYAALHVAIYGSHPSDYMRLSAAYGFNFAWLPWKAYLILVEPRPWFPGGEGLLRACPWLVLGMAGLIAAVAAPERRLAALCLLVTSIVYAGFILAYVDLLPSGLWRFNNVHYFKWLFPLLGLFALIFLRDAPRVPIASAVALAALVALGCIRLDPHVVKDDKRARVLIFPSPSPSPDRLRQARSVIVDRRGQLRNFFDYRQLPIAGGVMAVAAKHSFTGDERWYDQVPRPRAGWPRNLPGDYYDMPLSGPWPRRPLARFRPEPSFGLPCWLPPYPCDAANAQPLWPQ